MKSNKNKSTLSHKTRAKQFLAFAREHAKLAPSWLDLQNALVGIGGKMSELFPERPERSRFMKSEEYRAAMDFVHEAQGGDENTSIEELFAKAERDRRKAAARNRRKTSEPAA